MWFFSKKKKRHLIVGIKTNSGRNIKGFITVRHRGGSSLKRNYFNLNKHRNQLHFFGVLISFNKSFFTRAIVGLVKYNNGAFTYTIVPHGSEYGSLFLTAYTIFMRLYKIKIGFTTILRCLPELTLIFNLAINLKVGSQYAKAAGTFCQLIEIDDEKEMILLELPTKERKWVSWYSTGTVGRVSNIFSKDQIFGKAGFFRKMNVRPTVRGVAMNPVDHPHGGRTKINVPEVTPWGKIAKHSH